MNKLRVVVVVAVVQFLGVAVCQGELLYYDGQTSGSTYVNTTYDPTGLTYTMANGQAMPSLAGKRTTPGTGASGSDYLALNPTTGSTWDLAGLYDPVSGTIGGGAVGGELYVGFLLRAHYAVSSTTEHKTGDLPYGAEAAFQLDRTSGGTSVAMGNHWGAWAYSIFGTPGNRDLRLDAGGTTYTAYNANVHWMAAKITFNPNAADDITVWLDPNPDDRDNQNTASSVRFYSATGVGDLSFDEIAYRSGNIPDLNSWDFDEVRFATNWADLSVPEPSTLAMLLGLGGIGLVGFLRRRRRA